jgi:hypothetical protein
MNQHFEEMVCGNLHLICKNLQEIFYFLKINGKDSGWPKEGSSISMEYIFNVISQAI